MNSLSCFDFTYYRMAFYSTATPKYLSKAGVCILTLVVSLKHWNLYCYFFFTQEQPHRNHLVCTYKPFVLV